MQTFLDVSTLDTPFEYWIELVTFELSCLDSLLGYSAGGGFKALQLIVLAVFGVVD